MILVLLIVLLFVAPTWGADIVKAPGDAWAPKLQALNAGDRLLLQNGIHAAVNITCDGTTIKQGSSGAPIVIQAQNERQARVHGDGYSATISISGCQYWNFVGLHITTTDIAGGGGYGYRMQLNGTTSFLQIRRNLFSSPSDAWPTLQMNGYGGQVITDILTEENEFYTGSGSYAYGPGDNSIEDFGSGANRNVFRRNYLRAVNALNPVKFITYTATATLWENNIAEVAHNVMLGSTQVHAYGNIVLDASGGQNCYPWTRHSQYGVNGADFRLDHNLAVTCPGGSGVYISTVDDATIRHQTVIGADYGFSADNKMDGRQGPNNCYTPEGTCCITCPWTANPNVSVQDSLFIGTGTAVTGVTITHAPQFSALILDHLNVYNYPTPWGSGTGGRTSTTTTNPAMGGCMAWVPDTSPMKNVASDGTDIGARILYRYQNGVLTTTPLWNTTTGAFSGCGALVTGVNDTPSTSCSGVHTRLHINTADCPFPAGYGAGIPPSTGPFYVAPTGSPSNDCNAAKNIATPKQTIADACTCMAAGATLYLRAGTYTETFASCPLLGGSGESSRTIIAAYGSESVTVRAPASSSDLVYLTDATNHHYITFHGLIFDGNNLATTTGFSADAGVHHIRFEDGEIKNANWLVWLRGANTIEVLRTKIHTNLTALDAVMLLGTMDGTRLEGNEIYGSLRHGVYFDPAGTYSNTTLRANRIYNNTVASTVGASVKGTTLLLSNNLLYGNQGGIQVQTGTTSAKIYNNTLHNMTTASVVVDSGASGTAITNNIVSMSPAMTNAGTGTTFTSNLCTSAGTGCGLVGDPLFAGATAGNFDLLAGSPALETGVTLAEVPTDVLGRTRPQPTTGQYDTGGYESLATSGTPPVLVCQPGGIIVCPPVNSQMFMLPR